MATPVIGSPPAVDVTLSVFGGTDTEISPADLPEGLSPNNQDVIFLPGDVSSRPCLRKLYNPPFPNGVSVVYQKTFVQPNNNPLTLILTSDGKFWAEDVANAPGVVVNPFNVPAGLYAQSATAFGREYIAFSDLLHGQAVPLQADGTNADRVTQDGPGAAPTAADHTYPTFIISNISGLHIIPTLVDIASISENGNICTVQLTQSLTNGGYAAPQVGDVLTIAAVGTSGYNGNFVILQIDETKSIVQFFNPTAGLATDSAGTLTVYVVQVITTTANGYMPGQSIVIAGATNALFDGVYSIRQVFPGLGDTFSIPITLAQIGQSDSGNGTTQQVGMISPGTHEFVQMFLTRNGALTRPSPIGSWTALGGNAVEFTKLAIGPANVVARVIGLTGAGGGNFFSILANVNLPNLPGPPIVILATIIPDNFTTSAIFDFSDNALFAATPIDVVGNDLFDQIVLGPVMGFFGYGSRLCAWGDYQKVENFLNLGFCGGYLSGVLTTPLGWKVEGAGGTLVNSGSWPNGMSWQITGNGSVNPRGELSQGAYEDSFGDAILQPNTFYGVRVWAKVSAPNLAGAFISVSFESASAPLIFAEIPLDTVSTVGEFTAIFPFVGLIILQPELTPSTIPADYRMHVDAEFMPNGATVTIGEIEIIPTDSPYRNNLSRWSYVQNPEGFAQTTGNLGAADDSSPIQNFSVQRNVGLLHSLEGTHEFKDNNFEPGDGLNAWPVDALTHSVGALSLKACDPGKFGTGDSAEDWDIIASRNGVYIHLGANFYKVAQEMSRTQTTPAGAVTWDDINWAAQKTVWIKNHVNQRRAYIGAPVNGATLPNIVFVLDYREMDTAQQIANALPIHITLTGKMKSSDMTRKWTHWNIAANCAEILVRPGNELDIFFGGGKDASGTAYGNLYSLDSARFTDDDYGRLHVYYITYAFIDHDQEQQLQLGSGRKLYSHIAMFATGVGLVTIFPIVNSINNVFPRLSPRQLRTDADLGQVQPYDFEWTTGIHGQRVFFAIQVEPLPGTTDLQISLQKLIVRMRKDPVAIFRGSGV